VEVALVASQI